MLVPRRSLKLRDEVLDEQGDVLAALAQRGDRQREHVEAVEEVLAEAPRLGPPSRGRAFVAATTRTSTLRSLVSPTRRMVLSCSTRRSFTWSSIGSSPISSRKSVPPSASSKSPRLSASRLASVNAPFLWPKSSLSMRFPGMAPQLTATKGRLLRARRARLLVERARDELLAHARSRR
jgi:hypothetical protein